MQRSDVYKMIDGERAYQQAQGKPDERKEYDWLKSIDYYSQKAWRDVHENFPEHVRKIAALAVAALEQYGCEPREGYAPQPDSAQEMPKPDWSNAPEWAQWWAVECNGDAFWYETEPILDHCGIWDRLVGKDGKCIGEVYGAGEIDIPLGVDWRLLKQQRPATAPDAGSEEVKHE